MSDQIRETERLCRLGTWLCIEAQEYQTCYACLKAKEWEYCAMHRSHCPWLDVDTKVDQRISTMTRPLPPPLQGS